MAKLKEPTVALAVHEMAPVSAENIGHPDEGLIKVAARRFVQND